MAHGERNTAPMKYHVLQTQCQDSVQGKKMGLAYILMTFYQTTIMPEI